MGDFNFIWSVKNRNLPGGDVNDIMLFNEIISNVGLTEIPLTGMAYTWSNMQDQPLLQQLDWVFTSTAWNLAFPNTSATALSKYISDHAPCLISIETSVPRANLFRFENFWVDMPGFQDLVQQSWNTNVRSSNQTVILNGKLKNLKRKLKFWSKRLSNLHTLITNCNEVLVFLDSIEEQRPLLIHEWNFRSILKNHILVLLKYKNEFWRKRYTARWVKFGDENASFFQASATDSYRRNKISHLKLDDNRIVTTHEEKAQALFNTYFQRMDTAVLSENHLNLNGLLHIDTDLNHLTSIPSEEEMNNIIKNMPLDRAPGPDGFNGLFLKKCWHIISADF